VAQVQPQARHRLRHFRPNADHHHLGTKQTRGLDNVQESLSHLGINEL
jgi:hypothetical protein